MKLAGAFILGTVRPRGKPLLTRATAWETQKGNLTTKFRITLQKLSLNSDESIFEVSLLFQKSLLIKIKTFHAMVYLPTFFSVNAWDFSSPQNLNFRRFNDGFRRLPKIFDDFRRLPKISWRLPKITKGVERFSTTSKSKGFPTNLEHY